MSENAFGGMYDGRVAWELGGREGQVSGLNSLLILSSALHVS